MKEFDKVYLVKYVDVIGKWQVSEDLGISTNELEKTLQELKENGLYEIYYNLSDYEWEEMEHLDNEKILRIYIPKTKENSKRVIKELLNLFIPEEVEFPEFDKLKWDLKRIERQSYC